MTARRRLLLFALALLLALPLSWPLQLAPGLARLEAAGLSAAGTSGSLWDGRLRDARWRGLPMGDVAVSLQPWPLSWGGRRIHLEAERLAGGVAIGNETGIESLQGELRLADLRDWPGLDLRWRFDGTTVLFDGDRCVRAEGRVEVEATLPMSPEPLRLAGTPACTEGGAVLDLAPSGPGLPLRATLRLSADGRYELKAMAEARDPASLALLHAAGFQPGPRGASRIMSGSLLD